MSMPFTFLDAPSLMGSWPITPTYGLSGPTVLPRTLLYKARLLGTKKETVAGFDVVGRSFNLELDTGVYNIAFLGGATLTLQEVVDQINTAVGTEVAFLDNGFLLLESPTDGEASYVVVWTDPASTPTDVLWNLGLLTGVRITGGSPRPPSTSEPSRQIIGHQHLSVALGEAYSAEAVNRSLFQLAVNTDLDHGLVARKSQAKAIDSSVVNPGSGFTISDNVYTGPVSGPDEDELERVVVLLDQDGNEVVIENWTVLSSSLSLDLWYDTNSGKQWVSSNSGAIFSAAQQTDPIYIRSNNVALGALQGVPLKIMLFSTTTQVAVLNTNPATGDRVQIGTSLSHVVISDGELLEAVPTHVRATGLWTDSGMTQRVENVQFTKETRTITRVEGNNRLVCVGATFDTTNVAVGDLVYLTGHSITSPYSNNGTYRVSQVLDQETLELVSDSFGPVFLNPNGTLGSIVVKSDGLFYPDPYVSLNTAVPAGTYQLIYKQRSTLSDILNDVDALGGGDFSRYYNETDSLVEETLMKVLGPSATSFYDYTHDDDRISLESLEYRLDLEHDDVGRHTTIRPDYIEMGKGENARELESIWLYAHPDEDYGEAGEDNSKFVVSQSDGSVVFSVAASGWVQALDPIAGASCYMYPLGAEMGIDGDPLGNSAVQFRADSAGGNPMMRAYRMDGDVECMLQSQTTFSADHVARYYAYSEGDDGIAELWLYGAHNYNTSALDEGLGAASLHLKGGDSFTYPVEFSLNLRPQLRMLKLDCVNRGDGNPVNALTAWVNDAESWAIGVNTVDPGYKATHASRVGKFEVSTDTEWPFVARGTSSNSGARNHFVAVRDDGGTPLSGEYLGGLAMGGRFQAGRGNVSFGYDGGCEISAVAGEDWSATNRGAHLIFRTTPVGSASSFTSMYLYRDHLLLDGGLATYLHVGSSSFIDNRLEVQGTAVGTYSACSLVLGDQDLTNRYSLSLRGASEGTDYRRLKLFYQSSTGVWHEAFNIEPLGLNSTSFFAKLSGLYSFYNSVESGAVFDGDLKLNQELRFSGMSSDEMIYDVRGQHIHEVINARPHANYDFNTGVLGTSSVAMGWTVHAWALYGKYIICANYTGTEGQIYLKVVDTSTAPSPTLYTGNLLFTGLGIDSISAACMVNDNLYLRCHYSSGGANRTALLKFNCANIASPTYCGQYVTATASTGSSFGLVSDGVYLYFVYFVSGLGGDLYVAKVNGYTTKGDTTAPALQTTATLSGLNVDDITTRYGTTSEHAIAFCGQSLFWMYSSDNVGDVGTWGLRINAFPRTTTTPTLGEETLLDASTLSPNGYGQVVTDGIHVYYCCASGTNNYYWKYLSSSLIGSWTDHGGYSYDNLVDERHVYSTGNFAWWHNKYTLAVEMSKTVAGANASGVHGSRLLADHNYVYGRSGSTVYRSLKPG